MTGKGMKGEGMTIQEYETRLNKFYDTKIERLQQEVITLVDTEDTWEQQRVLGRIEGLADSMRYLKLIMRKIKQ
jgi:hypothetical protein